MAERMIQDFGKKIGGARKDVWKLRGLMIDDLEDMDTTERNVVVVKDSVWPKPDWKELIANGLPREIAYWQNEMRKAVPVRPVNNTHTEQVKYIAFVYELRKAVMAAHTESDVTGFYRNFMVGKNYVIRRPGSRYVEISEMARGIIDIRLLKKAQVSTLDILKEKDACITFAVDTKDKEEALLRSRLFSVRYDGSTLVIENDYHSSRLVLKKGSCCFYYYPEKKDTIDWSAWKENTFCVLERKAHKILAYNLSSEESAERKIQEILERSLENKKETENKKRKTKPGFKLHHTGRKIERTGPDYLNEEHITPEKFMNDLHFRGGEFGNWLSDTERQEHLDMAYMAFRDLAAVLKIEPSSVALKGDLSIAFGARGKGGANAASAHFEPLRNVINLTKMSGAGTLGHEWAHAFDHMIGSICAPESGKYASELAYAREMIPEMRDVIHAIWWKQSESGSQMRTRYYRDSSKFDATFRKSSHGYWHSDVELFARAFDCYLADKLKEKGIQSDYLTAYADSFHDTDSMGNDVFAYPVGEERKVINEKIDALVKRIREEGWLEKAR